MSVPPTQNKSINKSMLNIAQACFVKYLLAFVVFFLATLPVIGQKLIEDYQPQKDSLRIGPGKNDFLPYNQKGYTLILPDSDTEVKTVVVSIEDSKVDVQADVNQSFLRETTKNNIAVLYVSTGIPADLFFSEKSLRNVDTTVHSVLTKYNLQKASLFFLGVNLSAHRSLRYIEFCQQGKSILKSEIKGAILCESVLDWVRQWYEAKKAIRDKFAESSVFEGKLVTYLLEKNLNGTPKTHLEKYLDFSTYSYFAEEGRHLKFFKDLAVRAYTEPATYYWMEAKRKTTLDTNFPDMVGFINELKLAGNTKSELIVFNQDKSNMDRRNPNYTWGLVDKVELVKWILSQTK